MMLVANTVLFTAFSSDDSGDGDILQDGGNSFITFDVGNLLGINHSIEGSKEDSSMARIYTSQVYEVLTSEGTVEVVSQIYSQSNTNGGQHGVELVIPSGVGSYTLV